MREPSTKNLDYLNLPMQFTKTQKAVIALIIANIIWGAASPVFKWALMDIGVFSLAFLRFYIASIILLPFTYKNLKIAKEHIKPIFLVSFFGIFLNITLFFIALPYTSSINVPIIGSIGPIILLIFAALILKEKIKKHSIKGMIISLLGVLLIIFSPTENTSLDLSIKGNVLLIGATLASVISTIIAKRIAVHYDFKTITIWSFLISSMLFLPFMLNEIIHTGFLTNIGMQGIVGILFGSLLSSALAYSLFQYSLKYLNANETGIFTYIDPIAALIIAIPLLHEKITLHYIIGSVLVFAGIYLAEKRIHYHPIKLIKHMSEGLKSIV